MWAVKGHYYSTDRSFYNYPYMFGLLFGLGLYARYQADPEAFRRSYDDLLSSTGLADAATLANALRHRHPHAGFWRASLDMIRADIDRFERLIAVETGLPMIGEPDSSASPALPMNEAQPEDEIIDAGEDRIIWLSFGREWPKLAVHWAVRVQRGDLDYPLGAGDIDAMPPRGGDAAAAWADLRERAMQEAQQAIAARATPAAADRPSLLGRLFGRNSKLAALFRPPPPKRPERRAGSSGMLACNVGMSRVARSMVCSIGTIRWCRASGTPRL